MALALNNLKRVEMPLNKETEPIILITCYDPVFSNVLKQHEFHLEKIIKKKRILHNG